MNTPEQDLAKAQETIMDLGQQLDLIWLELQEARKENTKLESALLSMSHCHERDIANDC